MADITLTVDVASGIDVSGIKGQIQEISNALDTLPEKKVISIELANAGNVQKDVKTYASKFSKAVQSSGITGSMSNALASAVTNSSSVQKSARAYVGKFKKAIRNSNVAGGNTSDVSASAVTSATGVSGARKELLKAYTGKFSKDVSEEAKAIVEYASGEAGKYLNKSPAGKYLTEAVVARVANQSLTTEQRADQKRFNDALGVNEEVSKSAADSAAAMKMQWAMAEEEAREDAEYQKKADKYLAEWAKEQEAEQKAAEQTVSARQFAEELATGKIKSATDNRFGISEEERKSAADSAAAMKMQWAMAEEEARAKAKAQKEAEEFQKKATVAQDSATKSTKEGKTALKDWGAMAQSSSKTVQNSYTSLQEKMQAVNDAQAAFTQEQSIDNLNNLTTATAELNQQLNETGEVAQRSGTNCEALVGNIASMAAQITAVSTTFNLMKNAIKTLATNAIDIDDAMTQIRIVTNESDETYTAFGQNVAKTAQEIGASMVDIIDSTTTFSRLGYTLDESFELAEAVTKLSRVGDVDISSAQSSITSMIKAYDIDTSEIETVMGKLVTVGNNFPISVSEIATGMTNASSALAASGNSFEKSVALLTAANTTLQDAAKSSTGLRTITARIRKTDTELTDLGETMTTAHYEEMVSALSGYNVALTDANGEYRDTYDIMQDIANVWDDMTSSQQAALAEMMAGNRQQVVFYSIIQNFKEVAEKAMEVMSGEDMATAMNDAYGEYMDSVTAHIETFKAAVQGLSETSISTGFMSSIVDVGTAFVNIANSLATKTGGIGLAATSIVTLMTALSSLKNIGIASKLAGGSVRTISDLFAAATSDDAGSNVIKFFSDFSKGWKDAAASATASSGTIKTAFASLAGGAKNAWTNLSLLGKAGIVTAGIVAAVAVVNTAVSAYKQKQEEMRQEAEDNSKAYGETRQSLEEYADQITELRDQLKSGSLSESEAATVKQKLVDIQAALNEQYGKSAEGLDLVNGKLEDQVELLETISYDKAKEYHSQNRSQGEKAIKAMESDLTGAKGYMGLYDGAYRLGDESDKEYSAFSDMLDEYEHVALTDMGDGTFVLRFTGNVQEAKEELGELLSELDSAMDDYGEDSIFGNAYEQVKDVYDYAKEIIDDYDDIYTEYKNAEMVLESYGDETSKKTYGYEGSAAQKQAEADTQAAVDAYNNQADALKAAKDNAYNAVIGQAGQGLSVDSVWMRMDDVVAKEASSIEGIAAKYDHIQASIGEDGLTLGLKEGSTISDALQELSGLQNDLENAYEDASPESKDLYSLLSDWTTGALAESTEIAAKNQKAASAYQNALNAYNDFIKSGVPSEEMPTDILTDVQQSPIDWLEDYTEAINNYNEALESGDSEKIEQARSEFVLLDKTIQTLLKETDGLGKYATEFKTVADTLDETSIEAYDLSQRLSKRQDAQEIKNSGLTQSKFVESFINKNNQEVEGLMKAYADLYGLDYDELGVDQTQKAAEYFAEIGILAKDAADEIEDATSDAKTALEKSYINAGTVISNAQDVLEILQGQSTGTTMSQDTLNTITTTEGMEDYADALEYVNGIYQLNADKVNEVVRAKTLEQIAVNDTNKAMAQSKYLENARQIEELRKKLKDANYAQDETAESIQGTIDSLLTENKTLSLEAKQYDAISASLRNTVTAYQAWLDAQSASQAGDMFDDTLTAIQRIDDTLNDTTSDYYGRTGRSDYKTALDLIIPDSVDKDDEEAINSYLESISDLLTADDDGNVNGLDIGNFVQRAVENGLMVDNGDGYALAGKMTMEKFAEGMGLSMPLVQAMFGELEEYGVEFEWDTVDKTIGDIGVEATEAAEALRSIEGFSDLGVVLDVSDFEDSALAVNTIETSLEQLKNFKAKPEIQADPEALRNIDDMITYLISQKQEIENPAIMSVDVSSVNSDVAPALSLLQQFQSAQNTLELAVATGADTSEAQASIDSLVSQIQGLDLDVLAKIGLTPTSEEEIQAYISGLTAEAIISFGVDSSLVDGYEKSSHEATGTVRWNNDTSKVKTKFSAVGTITWNNTNPSSLLTGGLFGAANAGGSLNAPGGTSLVGELGREIVVDSNTGKWYTVGDNGAQFVNLPKGAIVFNHNQTESLLKNKAITSRGRAFVAGTLKNVTSLYEGNGGIKNSAVSGSLSKALLEKLKKKKSPSADPGNGGDGDGTTDDSDLEAFDWIELAIDRIERIIEHLGTIADSTFKALKTRLSATTDEIQEVTNEIDLQSKAFDRYIEEAEKVELSDELKAQVRSGAIDISRYDEDTLKLIEDYQKWYM